MNNLMLMSQSSVYRNDANTYLNLIYVADDFVIPSFEKVDNTFHWINLYPDSGLRNWFSLELSADLC